MSRAVETRRCPVCGERSLRRVKRCYERAVSHDGRAPVRVRIPDLEVIACTNPECHPEHPDDAIIEDEATLWRITEETYRQLGLLTPDEIRRARERLGMSQQELAELLALGGNSLSRWENGRVFQSRSTDTLLRVVFNVPAVLEFLQARLDDRGRDADLQSRFPHLVNHLTSTNRREPPFSPSRFLAGTRGERE